MRHRAATAVASAVMTDMEMMHMLLLDHPTMLPGPMQSHAGFAVLTQAERGMIPDAYAASVEAPIQRV